LLANPYGLTMLGNSQQLKKKLILF